MEVIQRYFIVLSALLLVGCAQMSPLDGGPRDMTAPIPDTAKMEPRFASINIFPEKIRIPFNEFIRLNNPTSNIIIVPEVNPRPEYKIKGKDLIIDLSKSQLDSNTTYSFYFNKAIQDFSEGNDSIMNYVFATGPVIDSLKYSCVVIEAEQGLPVAQVLVGLYSTADTIDPYKHKPKYFAQTDQQGIATFNYMAGGTFNVFAFGGSTATLKPGKADPIGFLSESIVIDTIEVADTIYLFPTGEERLRLKTKEIEAPGRIRVVATRDLSDATFIVKRDSADLDVVVERTNQLDSVALWIPGEENTSYNLNVHWPDTVLSARLFLKKTTRPIPFSLSTNLTKENDLGIHDTLHILTTVPFKEYDTARIQLLSSDSTVLPFEVSKSSITSLQIMHDFDGGKFYTLQVLPEGFTDFYDRKNEDTLTIRLRKKEEKNYAALDLVLRNAPEVPMILRLFNGKVLHSERNVAIGDSLVSYRLLDPGIYIIQIVLDANNNGQWDGGSFEKRIQPELCTWFREPITLRANWENKVNLEFKTPEPEPDDDDLDPVDPELDVDSE